MVVVQVQVHCDASGLLLLTVLWHLAPGRFFQERVDVLRRKLCTAWVMCGFG